MKEIFISLLMLVTGAFQAQAPVEQPVSQETPAPLGATILFPTGGGTGIGSATAGDIGKVLKVSNNSPFTYTLQTDDNSGGGGGSGTITTSTQPTIGNLAMWTTSGAYPEKLGTVGTTTLTASSPLSLSQPVVKIGGSNSVLTLTTSGAWSGTAGSLAANGSNCSAGQFPLGVDASGAVETCTDAWTEAENTAAAYTPNTRALTVAGTANQITSSAGSQNLTADRTWTLSFPNQVIFPQYASSTLGFSTPYASSTDLRAGTFTFGGVTGSTWSAFCVAITGGSGLCDGSDDGAGGGLTSYDAWTHPAAGKSATTSEIWVAGLLSTASSTISAPLRLSSLSQGLAYTGSGGLVGATATTTLSGNSQVAVSNTPVLLGASPAVLSIVADSIGDTQLAFDTGQALTTASSPTFSKLTLTYASTTYASFTTASTTNLIVNGESFNDLTGTGLALSGGALVTSNIPNASLANSTISGKALGTSLDALTATNGSLTFSGSYDGSTARTVGLNVGNANTWSALQTFNYSSSTVYSSFVTASSTFQNIGTLTFGGVTGSAWSTFCTSITGSASLCDGDDATGAGGGSDPFSHPQAGFSATTSSMIFGTSTADVDLGTLTLASSTANQLILGSGAGINMWGLRTLNSGDLALSTTTVAGTATTSIPAALFSSSGSAGLSIGSSTPWGMVAINPTAGAFANQLVVGSSTATNFVVDNSGDVGIGTTTPGTIFSVQGVTNFVANAVSTFYNGLQILVKLVIPTGTAPTMNQAGSLALDTTSNNLILATTTTGHIVVQSATTTLYAYTASTSPIVSGTTMNLPAHFLAQVATGVICKVSGGTSIVVNLSNAAGSSDTNTVTCTTTENQYALTSNNSFAAYGGIRVEYGTKTGDTGDLSIRFIGYRTSD